MSDRLNVSLVTKYKDKEGEERSRWTKVGVAFANKLGGWNLKFDFPVVAIPGQADIVLAPPKEQKPEESF